MPTAFGKLCKALPHTHCQLLGWTLPLTHVSISFVFYNYTSFNLFSDLHAVVDRFAIALLSLDSMDTIPFHLLAVIVYTSRSKI